MGTVEIEALLTSGVSSLLSALTVPVWSGEGGGWPSSKCWSGVVSGRAQEPGLLRLRQAPHPYHHQPYPPRLVSWLVPEKWFQKVSLLWMFVCSLYLCTFVGMPVVTLQQLQLLGTSKLTWWSCSVYWTQRSIWTRSQENCNRWSTPSRLALHFAYNILHWCVFPQYIYISDLSSGVIFKQNAQWLTDFLHCYHEDLVFTVMDTCFECMNLYEMNL